MSDQTLEIIYAIKQFGRAPLASVAEYMSEYTGSPENEYNEFVLYSILKNAYADYLSTCDNPAAEFEHLMNLFETGHFHSTAYILAIALGLTRVRDNDGQYINGFREQVK